ncbi:MAG: orotidine-5'-phosphate decarboxylase [Mycoplasmataceae bacterium]|jgi:orotidine-5'-phosphate decarboxylase|nr:orotidine-5'-phosphate decarboxylase [Mycoplasmataceae bacterium]
MERDVIIACDFPSKKQFNQFIIHFKKEKPFLKIGYQLFYAVGKEFITKLINDGYRIFLDLKLHDIPNTVEEGIKHLVTLGIDFITIHAAGGMKMMEAAVKGVKGTRTKILAVTQLTSISQEILEKELLIDRKIADVVHHYALSALEAGVHGVVCSGQECQYIKEKISNDLICVTPGIRLDDHKNDQMRTSTPRGARMNKSNFIVVGRPITRANNPLEAYHQFKKEFTKG